MSGIRHRRPGAAAAVMLLSVLGLAGCRTGSHHSGQPAASITVSSPAELLDRPLDVTVRGLPAGAATTVTATTKDLNGTVWTSSAQFTADPTGTVSLSQPSLGGSYAGANPMGLFEFLNPPESDIVDVKFPVPTAGFTVRLQAMLGTRSMAQATTLRQSPAAVGVTERDLRPGQGGLYGQLYTPPAAAPSTAKRPAVLVFGGSEGGLSRGLDAALLAAHGYPSLALAYFDEAGLPQTLHDIPLEYFNRALAVLRSQPGVDPHRVAVSGVSRGGELALILGSRFPAQVNAVIAGVPSSVVNPAVGSVANSGAAWTLAGRPLPTVPDSVYRQPTPAVAPQAVIAVERIAGPVLLTCGGQDTEWPSCPYTRAITARLSAHHFGHPVTSLSYPDAGHVAGAMLAYVSRAANGGSLGGSPVADQAASVANYAAVLKFLATW